MDDLGPLLYIIFIALIAYMWIRARTLVHDKLFDHANRDHHHVHAVLAKHPKGGSWSEFKVWMAETH